MRGKDLRSCHEGGKSPDHPRLCGEKFLFACRGTSTKGSPPPMRGKVVNVIRVVPKSRITPAYAGKRVVVGIVAILSRDHPRLCGEKGSF